MMTGEWADPYIDITVWEVTAVWARTEPNVAPEGEGSTVGGGKGIV